MMNVLGRRKEVKENVLSDFSNWIDEDIRC